MRIPTVLICPLTMLVAFGGVMWGAAFAGEYFPPRAWWIAPTIFSVGLAWVVVVMLAGYRWEQSRDDRP